jgi:hypothetical protein
MYSKNVRDLLTKSAEYFMARTIGGARCQKSGQESFSLAEGPVLELAGFRIYPASFRR